MLKIKQIYNLNNGNKVKVCVKHLNDFQNWNEI
jgi:hypothetical protein